MADLELRGLKGLRNLNNLTNVSESEISHEFGFKELPIESLKPGKFQPRQRINEESLAELVSSIKSQGIIQPIIVRSIDSGYEIIAGERRWRAAKLAALTYVPTIVRNIDDNVALAFALVENIQRENLNHIEEALAFARFQEEFQMSQSDIAEMVGRSRSSISNSIRLLTLPDSIKAFLETGQLDMGHARALLTLETNQQLDLAKKIVEKGLSVRDAEKLVQAMKSCLSSKEEDDHQSPLLMYKEKCKYWSDALSNKFTSKVSVQLNNKGTGKVVIHIDSPEEVDWLLAHVNIDTDVPT